MSGAASTRRATVGREFSKDGAVKLLVDSHHISGSPLIQLMRQVKLRTILCPMIKGFRLRRRFTNE
jgi:hypothetical protein